MTNRQVVSESAPWRGQLARAISILATFLLSVVIVRTLTISESGTFFFIFALLAVFATAGRFGTDNLAMKLSGRTVGGLGSALPQLWAICAIASIVCAGLAFAVLLLLPDDFMLDRSTAIVAGTAVVPQALSVLAGASLRGTGRLVAGTMAELGCLPILTIGLLLVWRGFAPINIGSAVLCLVAASWITALSFVTVAHARIANSQALPKARELGDFFCQKSSQMAPMMGTSLLFYGLTWAPVFVLTMANLPDQVSQFTAANRLAGFIALVPTIQVSYLAPRFAVYLGAGRLKELNELCQRSALHALAATIIPGLVLIVGGSFVLGIVYGPEFHSAAFGLALLSALGLGTVWAGQINQLLLLGGLEKTALVANSALALVWASLGVTLAKLNGFNAVCTLALLVGIAYIGMSILVLRRQGIIPTARFRSGV